jgi:tRNA uridine 5-carbamoylmethylation protein Kti12
MNLVYLYGPPAVGKLTVAKKLSKLTGYKIFHNHMTIDHAELIFEWGTKEFNELVGKYRKYTIEVASKSKLKGMIITFVYAHPEDDKYIKELIKIVENNNGKFLPVQLYCNKDILYKRLKGVSRKEYGKIKYKKKLDKVLKKYQLFNPMPFIKGLSIDNTKLSPSKAAQLIVKHYKLT